MKLGTITPDGGDIYSYEEDDSVTMPKERLAELLARLGIDIMKMVKTEKDMQELQLEQQLKQQHHKQQRRQCPCGRRQSQRLHRTDRKSVV